MTMYYHVYAEDGFESAHRSERAAIRAAKTGAKRRRLRYHVVATDARGLTGGGCGRAVCTVSAGGVVEVTT